MTPPVPCAKEGFVYILASKPNGTLYVGVTSDIVRRIRQHRNGEGSDFVEEYDVTRLVHLERYDDIEDAIRREKQASIRPEPRPHRRPENVKSTAKGDWCARPFLSQGR